MILKITGRYMFIDDSFLRFIASHIEYDAFIKDVGKQGRMRGRVYRLLCYEI